MDKKEENIELTGAGEYDEKEEEMLKRLTPRSERVVRMIEEINAIAIPHEIGLIVIIGEPCIEDVLDELDEMGITNIAAVEDKLDKLGIVSKWNPEDNEDCEVKIIQEDMIASEKCVLDELESNGKIKSDSVTVMLIKDERKDYVF